MDPDPARDDTLDRIELAPDDLLPPVVLRRDHKGGVVDVARVGHDLGAGPQTVRAAEPEYRVAPACAVSAWAIKDDQPDAADPPLIARAESGISVGEIDPRSQPFLPRKIWHERPPSKPFSIVALWLLRRNGQPESMRWLADRRDQLSPGCWRRPATATTSPSCRPSSP